MKQQRWIKSVIETASKDTPAMPWQRGARRAAFIAKRNAATHAATLKVKSA